MEVSSKRRNWIKNAVIIFLAVLLVLTFFSNTIMNRSLAQVATQYVQPQTITTAVRGTGTVKANADYEVEFTGDRTVKAVNIKVGAAVEAGDVLFELYEEEDGSVQALREELSNLEYEYRLALLNLTDTDYARENRDIADAKEALQELIAERDGCIVTQGDLSVASANVTAAEKAVDDAQEKVDKLTEELQNIAGSEPSGNIAAILAEYTKAQEEYEKYVLAYENEYGYMLQKIAEWAGKRTFGMTEFSLYSGDLIAKYEDATTDVEKEAFLEQLRQAEVGEDGKYTGKPLGTAGSYLAGCETYYAEALTNILAAKKNRDEVYLTYLGEMANSSGAADAEVNEEQLKEELKTAKEELKAAQKAKETADKIFGDLQAKQDKYDTLAEQVKTSERALEDLIFNLSEQKKTDNASVARDQLALGRQKEAIEKKREEIEKASSGEVVNTITAPVAGTITQVNISAGKKTSSVSGALCIIEEAGRGYTLSIPITVEQSRKLSIGDVGTVDTGWWWGSSITATLTAMTADPSNPQTAKIAHFTVEGDDVNAGDQLTISINQRSASYDMVVPSSAVREDSNGSYVLVLESKNTPLGDRYYAQRADVQVLTADDTNSAISGAVNAYDYVITSSSAPIEAGDQVRLSDK